MIFLNVKFKLLHATCLNVHFIYMPLLISLKVTIYGTPQCKYTRSQKGKKGVEHTVRARVARTARAGPSGHAQP